MKKIALGLIFCSGYVVATQISFDVDLVINRNGIKSHTVKSFIMDSGATQTYDFECNCVTKLTIHAREFDNNCIFIDVQCAEMKDRSDYIDPTELSKYSFLLNQHQQSTWYEANYVNGNSWKLTIIKT